MKETKLETDHVKITQFSEFQTVGELKSILNKFPDNLDFGFANQPFQNLFHMEYKKHPIYEALVFREPIENIPEEETEQTSQPSPKSPENNTHQ
jgi:hypothetical protein